MAEEGEDEGNGEDGGRRKKGSAGLSRMVGNGWGWAEAQLGAIEWD